MTERRRILRSLLEMDRPLDEILRELAGFPWDSEEELETLRPPQVIGILRRYASGTLGAGEVEKWANAVEGRDDIGFEANHRALLQEVIFTLANPALQGALSETLAAQWIQSMSALE